MVHVQDKNRLPPPSTPSAAGHNPEDTTAADPLEEPPATLERSYGFLVALQYPVNDIEQKMCKF